MERETFLFQEVEEINTRKVRRFYFRRFKREMEKSETFVFPEAEERNMWKVRLF